MFCKDNFDLFYFLLLFDKYKFYNLFLQKLTKRLRIFYYNSNFKTKKPFYLYLLLFSTIIIHRQWTCNFNFIFLKKFRFILVNFFLSVYTFLCGGFFLLLIPMSLLTSLWLFFFKTNTNTLVLHNSDKIQSINTIINLLPKSSYIYFYFYFILLGLNSVTLYKGMCSIFWQNHIFITNFSLWWVLLFFLLSVGFFFILRAIVLSSNMLIGIDYLFALVNLLLFLPYLFFTNNTFTFLFLLEVISGILFFKLISSKIWYSLTESLKTIYNIGDKTPYNYMNMIFFQYWITFFSTIYIVYFYINLYMYYGSSEWFIIQYLNYYDKNQFLLFDGFSKKIFFSVFFFSILFKLGITPFHLFKIEVYKGLPFLSIFFYTTYYFIVLFIYFLYVIFDLLSVYLIYNYINLVFILVVGSIYIIVLLFDVSFLKVFFTYSTIINNMTFLMLFVSFIGLN